MTQTTLNGSSTPALATGLYSLTAGDTLHLLGTIHLSGTISLDGASIPAGPPTQPLAVSGIAGLMLDTPTVTLGGGGTVLLANYEMIEAPAAGRTLVNNGVTITGRGGIGELFSYSMSDGGATFPFTFANLAGGVVEAAGTAGFIGMGNAANPLVNSGLIEASAGGSTEIFGSDVDQIGGGTLDASGTGSTLALISGVGISQAGIGGTTIPPGTIAGGVLAAVDGGALQAFGVTLDGTTKPVTIAAGSTINFNAGAIPTTLKGEIDNFGTLNAQTATGGYGSGAFVLGSPVVTLGGNGTIVSTWFYGTAPVTATLVNVGNVIGGSGGFGFRPGNTTAVPLVLTNEATGAIVGYSLAISATTLTNQGTIEAEVGGLSITGGALVNNGVILAAGGNLVFEGEAVQTDGLYAASGSHVGFVGSGNTLTAPSGVLTLGTGTNVYISSASVMLNASSIANRGTLGIDAATLDVAGAGIMLGGGGKVRLNNNFGGSQIRGSTAAAFVNIDNTVVGYGDITGFASLANDGTILGSSIAIAGNITNRGTIGANYGRPYLGAGVSGAGWITNTGGVIHMWGGTLDASVEGGVISGLAGNQITLGQGLTLDGSAALLSIAAGTVLRDYHMVYGGISPTQAGNDITLTGTVVLAGTIESPATGDPAAGLVSRGLLEGNGTIAGALDNLGTVVVGAGTFTVAADLAGAGVVRIAPNATFVLGGASAETIDFQGGANERLLLGAPSAFTGTLDNMALGTTIDLENNGIASATIENEATLSATLVSGVTMSAALENLAHGAEAVLMEPAAHEEVFSLSYAGTGTTNEPGYSATGSGSITLDTGSGGLLSVADMVGFAFTIEVTSSETRNGLPPGTDTLEYDTRSMVTFSASLGTGGTLAGLSFVTGYGQPTNTTYHVVRQSLYVTNTGLGAFMGNDTQGVTTQGSMTAGAGVALSTVIEIACFAEGTRLATASGAVAVEALLPGDCVATASGALRPVVWTGHRRVDPRRHGRGMATAPIRVAAGAFAPRVPMRDLWLSPDHAVLVDGALVPIRCLANGATIAREDVAVTYWHVELASHDVVLAEGLACESYLDTGNRSAFLEGDGAVAMTPEFSRSVWAEGGCAELLDAGPVVAAIRARLRKRAEALGWVLHGDPGLRLAAGGAVLEGRRDGAWVRFDLPPGIGSVALLSTTAVPHETSGADDRRRLGVAVAELFLDGHAVALDDTRLGEGWHAPEPSWRWTEGSAVLRVDGARSLALRLALVEPSWQEPLRAAAA